LVTDSNSAVPNGIITCMTLGPNAFYSTSFRACVEAANQASKAVVMFMRMAMEQAHHNKSL
jgi:hypothetical protein